MVHGFGQHLVSKQWGASGYAVTFPIAFNVVYNVLSIPQTTASTSNAYWGRFYITALTKNGFNVSDTGAGSNRWIAIGSAQPQWGFDSGTAEKNIVILPLPVINPLSGFACLTDSNGAGDIGIKSMSSTSIVVDVDTNKDASRNFYWLVIAL